MIYSSPPGSRRAFSMPPDVYPSRIQCGPYAAAHGPRNNKNRRISGGFSMPFYCRAPGGLLSRFSGSRYKHSTPGIFAVSGALQAVRICLWEFYGLRSWEKYPSLTSRLWNFDFFLIFLRLFSQVPDCRNLEMALIVVKVVRVDRVDRVLSRRSRAVRRTWPPGSLHP